VRFSVVSGRLEVGTHPMLCLRRRTSRAGVENGDGWFIFYELSLRFSGTSRAKVAPARSKSLF
jgi:hypothetical protein